MASSFLSTSSLCHTSHSPKSVQAGSSSSQMSNMSFLKRLRSNRNKHDTTPLAQPASSSSQLKGTFSSPGPNNAPASQPIQSTSRSTSNNSFSTPTYLNASPPTRRPAASNANQDPPPAYSPPAYTPPISTQTDDKYAFLSSFDTVFLIDDSGSMAGRSWSETAAALSAIAPTCTSHDADGIDIYFLNERDEDRFHNITKAADVARIFQSVRPKGGTPTGERLWSILKPRLRDIEIKGVDNVKPLNIIVITDGEPSDDVESTIRMAVRKLEKADAPAWQIGIQFFQVGNQAGAAAALRELDDNLEDSNCPRDIVDTVPWGSESGGLSADGILKVVLGAVNKKLDRKRNSSEELRSHRRR